MCEDNIAVTLIIQSNVIHYKHTYLFHRVMNRTEAIISQHLYWYIIRNTVWVDVKNGDTFQRKKPAK